MSEHHLGRVRKPVATNAAAAPTHADAPAPTKDRTGAGRGGEDQETEAGSARAGVAPRLDAAQRRAQVAALCGVMLARNRRYDAAEARFTEAVRLDPDLDLTAVEGFWTLPRGAQDAAIRAYERAGRARDAAALAAWLRWTFRPRVLPESASSKPAS